MSNIILITIVTMSVLGIILAMVLYLVAKKFKVEEDPRIDIIEATMPGANCGGCGFAGCRDFATACVKAGSLEGKFCPVGGNAVMKIVGEKLGLQVEEKAPSIAVVRCNGNCDVRPRTSIYDGSSSCRVSASLYNGDTDCAFGCLGLGDCEAACPFDSIKINRTTGLPEVNPDTCTACGSCVSACPKQVIELRPKGPKDRRLFVACRNKDKGGVARKACTNACIGCKKCEKVCNFEAISVTDNLAYIDPAKCRLCRKCAAECPTGAIHEVNFPPRPPKPAAAPASPAAPAAPAAPATETLKKEE